MASSSCSTTHRCGASSASTAFTTASERWSGSTTTSASGTSSVIACSPSRSAPADASLLPGARGKGYATEAARAYVEWGFEHLDAPYFISLINPDNAPSRRVADRLGMSVLREQEFEGEPHLIYALRR
jgi:hypothetical protein